MGTFFQELAKKLADRWITLLLVPGALFLVAAAAGTRLGQQHALDVPQFRAACSEAAAWIARQPSGGQAMAVIAVLLGATGAGLAVQAFTGVTRMAWLGAWPRALARRRVQSRRRRYRALLGQLRDLQRIYPKPRTDEQQGEIDTAAARVNRLAKAEPGRPTWMGDQIHALEAVAMDRHGVDLAFAWPRLWLVLPDSARSEITTAHAAFAAAAATSTWACPYLLLGTLWWPAAVIGIGIGITGWVHARAAVADLAAMSEAALDLYGRSLATALGAADPDHVGPLSVSEGQRLTALMRKGR